LAAANRKLFIHTVSTAIAVRLVMQSRRFFDLLPDTGVRHACGGVPA